MAKPHLNDIHTVQCSIVDMLPGLLPAKAVMDDLIIWFNGFANSGVARK